MSKKKLLIYGAGAIGRGYIPWVYRPELYEYYYVEPKQSIRRGLNENGHFITYMTGSGGYEALAVPVAECFAPGGEFGVLKAAAGVITCVGPRNFMGLQEALSKVDVPVVCCENDSKLPSLMKKQTRKSNIVFAIPDVITSNTASPALLKENPLAIVTEAGTFYVDDRAASLEGDCRYVDPNELSIQWAAKLYIHNTPHCIAAYLGSLMGCDYVHEAMQSSEVGSIIEGAMQEMVAMLEATEGINPFFLRNYAEKELSRFRNSLLCDPISRVAREPFRKLAPDERLIGAAQRCLTAGILPQSLMLGIMAAFMFESDDDPDRHIKYLMASLSPRDFLRIAVQLRDDEPLGRLLIDRWDEHRGILRKIRDENLSIA